MTTRTNASPRPNRRTFLQGGAAAALTAASYQRVIGANDRIGLGFIGFGLIGKRHVLDFQKQPDASLVALAEVHAAVSTKGLPIGGNVRKHGDFRALLDHRDVDAVVVSTPDHWHALMTMMACAAGKDVYVEKPLSLFVREGRWMVDVARRYKRVVQVGTQQRSGPHYRKARELIQNGRSESRLGPDVGLPKHHAGLWISRRRRPAAELDYSLWLGPRPDAAV